MPKKKSHRGAKKRFKITASGKLKRRKGFKGHLLVGKSSSRRRRLKKLATVPENFSKKIKKII